MGGKEGRAEKTEGGGREGGVGMRYGRKKGLKRVKKESKEGLKEGRKGQKS